MGIGLILQGFPYLEVDATMLLQSMEANSASTKKETCFSFLSYEEMCKVASSFWNSEGQENTKNIHSYLWMILPHLIHNSEDMELPFITLCQRFEDFPKPLSETEKMEHAGSPICFPEIKHNTFCCLTLSFNF